MFELYTPYTNIQILNLSVESNVMDILYDLYDFSFLLYIVFFSFFFYMNFMAIYQKKTLCEDRGIINSRIV